MQYPTNSVKYLPDHFSQVSTDWKSLFNDHLELRLFGLCTLELKTHQLKARRLSPKLILTYPQAFSWRQPYSRQIKCHA